MFTLVEAATRPRPRRTSGRRSALLAAASAVTLAVAGCGGDDGDSDATTPAASDADATVATLEVQGFGQAVATPAGKPVFVLTSDPKGGSKCAAACLKEHKLKPLTASGEPGAGEGTKADLLSTFDREDGETQVLYKDQAVYTFTGEGLITPAGEEAEGGQIFLVDPDGAPIEQSVDGGY